MNTAKRLLIALTVNYALMLYTPLIQAEETTTNPPATEETVATKGYGAKVGSKALNGVTNIASSFLEIPKNMINVTNAENSNIFFGIVGGGIKGLMDMMGRVSAGIADVITAPLPTKPITQPPYIWQDFDASTSYDDVFRLEENKTQ